MSSKEKSIWGTIVTVSFLVMVATAGYVARDIQQTTVQAQPLQKTTLRPMQYASDVASQRMLGSSSAYDIRLGAGTWKATAGVNITVAQDGTMSVAIDPSRPIFLGEDTGTPPPPPPVDGLTEQIKQRVDAVTGDPNKDVTVSQLSALTGFIRSQLGTGLSSVEDVRAFWKLASDRIVANQNAAAAWQPFLTYLEGEIDKVATVDGYGSFFASVEVGLGGGAIGDGFLRDLLRDLLSDLLNDPEVRKFILDLIIKLITGGGVK